MIQDSQRPNISKLETGQCKLFPLDSRQFSCRLSIINLTKFKKAGI